MNAEAKFREVIQSIYRIEGVIVNRKNICATHKKTMYGGVTITMSNIKHTVGYHHSEK